MTPEQYHKDIIKRLERIERLLMPRTIKHEKPADCIGKCHSDLITSADPIKDNYIRDSLPNPLSESIITYE